jgi:hypothetical protein
MVAGKPRQRDGALGAQIKKLPASPPSPRTIEWWLQKNVQHAERIIEQGSMQTLVFRAKLARSPSGICVVSYEIRSIKHGAGRELREKLLGVNESTFSIDKHLIWIAWKTQSIECGDNVFIAKKHDLISCNFFLGNR